MNTEFYKPVEPFGIYPMPIPILPYKFSFHIFLCLCCVLFGLLIGFAINLYAKKRWKRTYTFNIIIPTIAAGLLFLIFGFSVTALKGLIFCTMLLYATNSDLSTREVTNWIPFSIALTGLIGVALTDIPYMLLSALFVTLPQLLVAIRKENCYGGGDIKVSAACGFLLGIEKGIWGLIAGLLIAVLCTLVVQRIKNKMAEAFPLIPYLAAGFMAAYII